MAWLTSYGPENLVVESSQTMTEGACTYNQDTEAWEIWSRVTTVTEWKYVGMDEETAVDCKAALVAAGYNATLVPENNGGGFSVRWSSFSAGAWA